MTWAIATIALTIAALSLESRQLGQRPRRYGGWLGRCGE